MINNFFNPQCGGKSVKAVKEKDLLKEEVLPVPERKLVNGKYVVKSGDTLWDLSWEFLGTPLRWREIAKLNNVPYGHIEPEDELYIPGKVEHCPFCGRLI